VRYKCPINQSINQSINQMLKILTFFSFLGVTFKENGITYDDQFPTITTLNFSIIVCNELALHYLKVRSNFHTDCLFFFAKYAMLFGACKCIPELYEHGRSDCSVTKEVNKAVEYETWVLAVRLTDGSYEDFAVNVTTKGKQSNVIFLNAIKVLFFSL
jgi:hypothetical protein